jgi:multiple sugar transport system substrate-binding protein
VVPGAAAAAPLPTPNPAPPANPANLQGGNLVYLTWQLFDHQKETEQKLLATPFGNAHGGTNIDITVIPGFDDYTQKLDTAFAANTPPDVFSQSIAYTWDFANLSKVLNLQPYVDRDLKVDDYFMNIAQGDRFPLPNGPLYSVPYQWVCSVLYYNKDLFDKAGVKYPDQSWTYDTLLDAAKELTKNGNYGFDSSPQHTFLDALISSNGGQVLDDAYTKCVIDQPIARDAIQWTVDLVQKYKVAPTAKVAKEAGLSAAGSVFASGRVAMSIDGSWAISQMLSGTSFNWDIAMVPSGKVKRAVYGGPDQYAIPSAVKNPDLAWEWLKFIIGPDRPLESFSAGAVPFYKPKALSAEWLARAPQNLKIILDTAPYIEGAEFGHNWQKWRIDTMNSLLAPAYLGDMSVDDAIAKTVTEVNKVLSQPF